MPNASTIFTKIFHVVLLATAVVMLVMADSFAQSGATPAQKKLQKETAALFEGLEVSEFTLVSSSIRMGGKLQPVLKLRNKTSHVLEVPFVVGISAVKGGVVGYPSWQIERLDKKGVSSIRHDGSLVQSLSIEPGGVVMVDSRSQTPISPETLGLLPGEYKIGLSFRPHGSVGKGAVQPLIVKPLKFTVLPDEVDSPSTGAAATGKAAVPSSRIVFSYGKSKINPDAAMVDLSDFMLVSESIKSGAPLVFSVKLNLSKGRSPLATTDSSPPLNFAWIIHRLITKNGIKSRLYFTHLTVGIGRSQWLALCQQGELQLKSEIETVSFEPGTYELSLRFWQTGDRSEDGFEVPRPILFKVVK